MRNHYFTVLFLLCISPFTTVAEPVYSAANRKELFDKFFDGQDEFLPLTYEITYEGDEYLIFQRDFGGHGFIMLWIYRGKMLNGTPEGGEDHTYWQIAHLKTTTARVKIEFEPSKGIISLFDIGGDFLASYSLEQLSSSNTESNITENRIIEKEPAKYSWENWKKAFLEQF